MAETTKCDVCKEQIDIVDLVIVVHRYVGGKEKRWFVCKNDVEEIERRMENGLE